MRIHASNVDISHDFRLSCMGGMSFRMDSCRPSSYFGSESSAFDARPIMHQSGVPEWQALAGVAMSAPREGGERERERGKKRQQGQQGLATLSLGDAGVANPISGAAGGSQSVPALAG